MMIYCSHFARQLGFVSSLSFTSWQLQGAVLLGSATVSLCWGNPACFTLKQFEAVSSPPNWYEHWEVAGRNFERYDIIDIPTLKKTNHVLRTLSFSKKFPWRLPQRLSSWSKTHRATGSPNHLEALSTATRHKLLRYPKDLMYLMAASYQPLRWCWGTFVVQWALQVLVVLQRLDRSTKLDIPRAFADIRLLSNCSLLRQRQNVCGREVWEV